MNGNSNIKKCVHIQYMEKCRVEVQLYTFLTLTLRGDWPVWWLCRLSLGKQPLYPIEMRLCGPSNLSGLLSEEITYAAGNRSLSRRTWEECHSPFVNISQHVRPFTLSIVDFQKPKLENDPLSAIRYCLFHTLRISGSQHSPVSIIITLRTGWSGFESCQV